MRSATLLLLVGAAASLHAQGPQLVVGQRVRVSVSQPAQARWAGVLRGVDAANLQLQTDAETLTIPRSTITSIEQSTGKKPNVTGGIIGGLLGLAVGGAVGCLFNKDDYGVYCGGQDDTKVIVGAVVGGLAGAAVGALGFKKEGWRPAQ